MSVVARPIRPTTPAFLQEDLRVGAIVRVRRRRAGLRQEDVARIAGVSRQSVSLVERGRLIELGVRSARAVAAAVGIDLGFAVRGHGASIDRLLDEEHSAPVDAVVRQLEGAGWVVVVEFSFNHYGDRGSVDVLAWHADRAALLIVEVKSQLTDLQALCRSMDVKQRIVPRVVADDRGWRPRVVGAVIVLPDASGQWKAVARRRPIFDAAFPARTVEIKRWLSEPYPPGLHGIWFLDFASTTGTMRCPTTGSRVRRPRADDSGPSLSASTNESVRSATVQRSAGRGASG